MAVEQEQYLYPEVIMQRDLPCWYELSWQDKPSALILKIHKDFIENQQPLPPDSPLIKLLEKDFELDDYNSNFSEDVGFGNVFKNRGEDERGFVVFKAEIPQVKRVGERKCPNCKGSKYDTDLDRECLYCEGTGKKIYIDWKPAHTLSASLTILTTYLSTLEKETSSKLPQLLTLETITQHDMHGGEFWGTIGLRFHNYLKTQTEESISQIVVPPMKNAYQKMLGASSSSLSGYRFSVLQWKNGALCINCPGDACGINPQHDAEYSIEHGHGYKFDCHNGDTPMQQITLIAGLAALHDCARKEMK